MFNNWLNKLQIGQAGCVAGAKLMDPRFHFIPGQQGMEASGPPQSQTPRNTACALTLAAGKDGPACPTGIIYSLEKDLLQRPLCN